MDAFTVQDPERIDKLLAKQYPQHSRAYFQYLIEERCITCNGEAVKKRTLPKIGDTVEVFFLHTPEIQLKPQNIPLDILYEDAHLLCINKEAGMVVHPAPGHHENTVVNGLLFYCQSLPQQDLRPGIVHRLDRDTSGVLVVAKTPLVHQRLIAAFSDRTVHKEYLAVTVGNPGTQSINAPIGRHPVKRKEMTVIDTGREAITYIETLAVNGDFSLVKAKPITGRTHQIRVHLQSLNTPILGDSIYGPHKLNHKLGVSRQLLHAHTISLSHPILDHQITLTAPPPLDLQKWIKTFGYQYIKESGLQKILA